MGKFLNLNRTLGLDNEKNKILFTVFLDIHVFHVLEKNNE